KRTGRSSPVQRRTGRAASSGGDRRGGVDRTQSAADPGRPADPGGYSRGPSRLFSPRLPAPARLGLRGHHPVRPRLASGRPAREVAGLSSDFLLHPRKCSLYNGPNFRLTDERFAARALRGPCSMTIRTFQPGDDAVQVSIYNEAAADLPKFKPATID